MSVVIETTLGDITVDLFLSERPTACMNFLKLCKLKYYNYNLFHTISRGFMAQTGDPTGSRTGGESIFGLLNGPMRRYFQGENKPRIKHTKMGLISFVGNDDFMLGSQFFITLGEDLIYLDEKHCVFGEVVEGFDTLEMINEVICDGDDRPYQDVRITHAVILDDPFPDPKGLRVPSRSPSPSAARLIGGRIAPDEELDEMEGKNPAEVAELQADREAKARATILEMVGDIPDADMAPPENVLFVCKLNPVTTDEDLEIIFNRFGKIKSCEVIRDRKTGDSLQYAFIEFEDGKSCEDAYFKMDNILIDDRRIHVDFSQSVSKMKWLGKGRGVTHYDDNGTVIENSKEKGLSKNKFDPSRKYENNFSKREDKRERYFGKSNEEGKKHSKYGKEQDSHRLDTYNNGHVDSRFHTRDQYSHQSRKNRSEYDKKNKYSKRSSNIKKEKNKDYVEVSSSKKKSETGQKKRYTSKEMSKQRNASSSEDHERSSNRRHSSKRKDQKRFSPERSNEYMEQKSSKKHALRESRKKHKSYSDKYEYQSKSISSRKDKSSNSSTNSSDSENDRNKKIRIKYSKRRASTSSDSSSKEDLYNKKKKKK